MRTHKNHRYGISNYIIINHILQVIYLNFMEFMNCTLIRRLVHRIRYNSLVFNFTGHNLLYYERQVHRSLFFFLTCSRHVVSSILYMENSIFFFLTCTFIDFLHGESHFFCLTCNSAIFHLEILICSIYYNIFMVNIPYSQ